MRPLIGVGLIVKNEAHRIARCLDSVRSVVDILCVVDTGSTDETEKECKVWAAKNRKRLIFRNYTDASVLNDGWQLVDWAKARNKYVNLLDRHVDFILAMDADDELQMPHRLGSLSMGDVYALTMKMGDCTFHQHRLWRTKMGYRYKYPVFEYLAFDGVALVCPDIVVKTPVPDSRSSHRNLKILETVENPDSRMLFYYGKTLFELGNWEQAAEKFDRYLTVSTFHDEMALAHLYRMRCRRAQGLAIDRMAFKAMVNHSQWSEIPMELAYQYVETNEWDKAIGMCYLALQKPPVTSLWVEKDKYESEPRRIMQEAFLGKNGLKNLAPAR